MYKFICINIISMCQKCGYYLIHIHEQDVFLVKLHNLI